MERIELLKIYSQIISLKRELSKIDLSNEYELEKKEERIKWIKMEFNTIIEPRLALVNE